MNKKLAVIDLGAAPLILAAAVIGLMETWRGKPAPTSEEEATKALEGPIADELEKLDVPSLSIYELESGRNADRNEADLSTVEGRAAELQGVHVELKRTLSRLDRLNGPRELSRAATMIGEAFMLISPLIQDAKGEAVEPDTELTEEEIAAMERGLANVHRNAGAGGASTPPAATSRSLNERTDLRANENPDQRPFTLRERAEAAFTKDAESKNWTQPDGKTPLMPFHMLPEEEKALWDSIVLEGDSAKQEALAEEIYATFEGAAEHPWQPGGNSMKQDEARLAALQQLDGDAEKEAKKTQLVSAAATVATLGIH